MKKIILNKFVLGFICGMFAIGSSIVIADAVINASNVTYKPEDSKWKATNVSSALNDLYNASTSLVDCKQGTFTLTNSCSTEEGCLLTDDFAPTKFFFWFPSVNNSVQFYNEDIDSVNAYRYVSSPIQFWSYKLDDYFDFSDNQFVLKNWITDYTTNKEAYYIICK